MKVFHDASSVILKMKSIDMTNCSLRIKYTVYALVY